MSKSNIAARKVELEMKVEVDNDHCVSIYAESDSDRALVGMWRHMIQLPILCLICIIE